MAETLARLWGMVVMTFQKIICPTDFSEASYAAFKQAAALAVGSRSEICVLHVEQNVPLPHNDAMPAFTQSEAGRRAEAVANLCAIVNERLPASLRTRPLLKTGEAAAEIIKAAREEGADLIVMTRHGAGNSEDDSLGRVAEDVLRKAPCPVLSVVAPVRDETSGRDAVARHAYDDLPPEINSVSSKAIFLDGD
jgi:nucleotide-binding universal stress UspA family protein